MPGKAATVFLTYGGKTLPLTDWALLTGISYGCLYQRYVTRGWSVAKTLRTGARMVPRRPMPDYHHIADAIAAYLDKHPEEAVLYRD